ncbi:MAG: riboflavin synthase [Deltaproteobacteria bacterium]|nr:riboflavin synthase [Deltaproteobacteria bacterium]
MFTGLVRSVGEVAARLPRGKVTLLRVRTELAEGLKLGDSLAVNGVCLTVVRREPGVAEVEMVPETLARTTLGELVPGARVNLEPALSLGEPLGGHLVQGHVDGVGHLRAVVPQGESRELTFEAPEALLRYVVEKGSIAVDGVSLTVAALEPAGFRVALVPHTLQVTTLGARAPGDRVNLEVDLLAKYVERLLGAWSRPEGGRLTEAWLREQGYVK